MPISESEYINSILARKRCEPLSREEEYDLFTRFRKGDAKAGERIVEANLRFVRGVVIGFINRGLGFSELMSEGAIGLRIALPRHDPDKEVNGQRVKFISYAVWWVRQRVMIAIAEQAHPVKLPPGFVSIAKNVDRARRKAEQALGRSATPDEVAEAASTTVARIMEVLGSLGHSTSLNATTVEGGDTEYMDMLEATDRADDTYQGRVTERTMSTILDALSKKDRDILTRLLGLGEQEPETLQEVGDRYGVSRERIRQRRNRALPKLRKQAEKMNLYTPKAKGIPK